MTHGAAADSPRDSASDARTLLGVDVGGTKIAAGLVSYEGALLAHVVRPTPAAEGPAAVLDAIAAAVRELPGRETADGLGIGTGGVVDREHGIVRSANDLLPGWAGTRLAAELGARLDLPVAADNDANVFALAEQTYGAGAGADSALYVSVGTGIGGGLAVGGRLRRGAHWTAGEFGHLPAPEAAGRACNCGIPGHLEAVASGPAITARFRALSGLTDVSDLRQVVALAERAGPEAAAGPDAVRDPEAAAGPDAVRDPEAARGPESADGPDSAPDPDSARTDPARAARQALREGAGALGSALAGLVNAFDPERVVLGGGVASIGAPFWEPLTEAFAAGLLPGPAGLRPVPAALGPRAAVIGAAALLLEDTA